MNKQKKFSKNYAHELMSIAEADLASARDLQTMKTHRVENILFKVTNALAWCQTRLKIEQLS